MNLATLFRMFLLWNLAFTPTLVSAATSVLPSWKEGEARSAIIDYVERVTNSKSNDFLPEAERIAVFDNDGTLWAEKPIPFQIVFAIDRIKTLASQHPEWKDKQPFKGVLEGDLETALSGGKKAVLEVLIASHEGMSTDEFEKIVASWITKA